MAIFHRKFKTKTVYNPLLRLREVPGIESLSMKTKYVYMCQWGSFCIFDNMALYFGCQINKNALFRLFFGDFTC